MAVTNSVAMRVSQVMEPGRGETLNGTLVKYRGPRVTITLTNLSEPLFWEVYEVRRREGKKERGDE